MSARTTILATLGWAVLVPLIALALGRAIAWDATKAFVWANAATVIVFIPAWLVAGMALALRRWGLFTVSVALSITHLGFVLPELLATRPLPQRAAHAQRIRVFSGNIFEGNPQVGAYGQEIRSAAPDLVVLQEASPAHVESLAAVGALDGLSYRAEVSRRDPFALFVASRYPLSDVEVRVAEGLPVLLSATVAVGARSTRLWAVHTMGPTGPRWNRWQGQLEALHDWLGAEQGPLVVAGDLNATWGHRGLRRLLDSRLIDAAAARGKALQMTWPRNLRFLPPLVRIDHLLTRGGPVVTTIRTGNGLGSDHRPLIAEITLP